MNSKKFIPLILFSFLLSFSCVQIKAQNERDSALFLSNETEKPLNIQPNFNSLSDSVAYTPNLYMDLKKYKAFLSPYQNFMIYSPLALDLDNRTVFQLAQKLYLTLYDTQEAYIGLGKTENRGFDLIFMADNGFSMEIGMFYILQYGYILNSKNRGHGYRLKANYDITNKLQLSIYGQYLLMQEKIDPFLNYMNIMPKTHIGTSINYKPKKNTDIGVNIEYQYDKINKEWKPDAKGKVTIGF